MSIKFSALIFILIYVISMSVYFIGGGIMEWNSAFVALLVAIIGLIGSVAGNIITNFLGWRHCKKMIGDPTSNKTLTAMIGTDGADKVSLSGEHSEIQTAISKNTSEIKSEIDSQKHTIHEIFKTMDKMDRCYELDRAKHEERERLLSNDQLDIKNTVMNIQTLFDILEKQNSEINSLKSQVIQLKQENEKLITEKNRTVEKGHINTANRKF